MEREGRRGKGRGEGEGRGVERRGKEWGGEERQEEGSGGEGRGGRGEEWGGEERQEEGSGGEGRGGRGEEERGREGRDKWERGGHHITRPLSSARRCPFLVGLAPKTPHQVHALPP